MKKIYVLAAGLILSGSIIGQGVLNTKVYPKQKADLSHVKRPVTGVRDQSKSNTFAAWVEPVGDLMVQLSIDETGASTGNSQASVVVCMYQDSTVTQSDPTNGTMAVSEVMLGSVLDPNSQFLQASLSPYITPGQPYYLDSLEILGSYVQVNTSAMDTLYVWITWGDTTTSSAAFGKLKCSTAFNAPLSTFRYEVMCNKVTGAKAGPGNAMKSTVSGTNMKLIKYVLQSTDASTVATNGVGIKAINIPMTTLSIPANNIVSCYYEFVPQAGSYTPFSSCSFAFSGAPTSQTVNGFAGCAWQQSSPADTSLASFANQQIDPNGWNMGMDYNSYQRHLAYGANSGWNTIVPGNLILAPQIYYKISSNFEGVSEINNDFMLMQNQPNPFTTETTVRYKLNKSASDVAVQIYDIRGVKMYEKTEKNKQSGVYSLNISDVNFASGVYFCTLVVDGAKVTNKIIKQ